jgi:hypothetical protein
LSFDLIESAIGYSVGRPTSSERLRGLEMDNLACARAREHCLSCAWMRQRPGWLMRLAPRRPSAVRLLQQSSPELADASQCPKIIAPIAKMAALIEIRMAAFLSEIVGEGFITR